MLDLATLEGLARARLEDAQALIDASRYDGAVYICGYALELALKHRICTSLAWTGFPETRAEFQGYNSLKTHDLDVLLRFSGVEAAIKGQRHADWSTAVAWDPEARYRQAGTAGETEARQLLGAVETLLGVLL